MTTIIFRSANPLDGRESTSISTAAAHETRHGISYDMFRCNVSLKRKPELRFSNIKIKSSSSEKSSHSEQPEHDADRKHSSSPPEKSSGSEEEPEHPVAREKNTSSLSNWKKWVVGITLSVVLPSYRHKHGPLGILKYKVNEVIETTETVTEVVEDVAEGVKTLAEELESRLPAKHDKKLKDALDLVEKFADETIKTTNLAQELIDQVEEVQDKLETVLDVVQARKEEEKEASHKHKD